MSVTREDLRRALAEWSVLRASRSECGRDPDVSVRRASHSHVERR